MRRKKNQPNSFQIVHRSDYINKQFEKEKNAKIKIAKWIVENFVENNHAVLLDTGSTAELIARELFQNRKYLSVLTNNMGAYIQYADPILENKTNNKKVEGNFQKENKLGIGFLNGNELIITGGLFKPIHEGLFGEDTISSIKRFNPNVSIIGISGLTRNNFFCRGKEDYLVKKAILERPTEVRVIATDWTKIGKPDAHSFGVMEDFMKEAKKAIIVTSQPPEIIEISDKDSNEQKEIKVEINKRINRFRDEINKLEEWKGNSNNLVIQRV